MSEAERRSLTALTGWGRWVVRRLVAWLQQRNRRWGSIARLIIVVNVTSLGLIVFTASVALLPPLLIVATGFHTGVAARVLGGSRAWLALLMPHAWLEIPAIVIGSAASLQAAAGVLGLPWFDVLAEPVWAYALFFRVCVPLLIGAAIIEGALMASFGYPRSPTSSGQAESPEEAHPIHDPPAPDPDR